MEINFIDYINRGGLIVYILIFLNIIGFSIILWKLIIILTLSGEKDKIAQDVLTFIKTTNNSFEKEAIKNAIDIKIKYLEFGLNTIKIIATISPLLGLLGTVIGVLNSFDSITKNGLGNPSIFSNGISMALITTVAGLIVAIPHYISYNYLIGMLDNMELKIEKEVIKSL